LRTTLTLEDDVAAAIERRRRQLNHTLKEEVNSLLRAGLVHVEERRPMQSGFRVEPLDVGELLLPIDDVQSTLDIAEGPLRK
jgi:hypothetical protein